jgi:hypothetical protein
MGPAGDIIGGGYEKVVEEPSEDQGGTRTVTGIAVPRPPSKQQQQQLPQSQLPMQSAATLYFIAALGTGKAVRVEIGSSTSGAATPRSARPDSAGKSHSFVGKDLFHFHAGAVYGLSADSTAAKRLCATVGEDKKLMLWDIIDCELLGKAVLKVGAVPPGQ